jgi:hypothetical protein
VPPTTHVAFGSITPTEKTSASAATSIGGARRARIALRVHSNTHFSLSPLAREQTKAWRRRLHTWDPAGHQEELQKLEDNAVAVAAATEKSKSAEAEIVPFLDDLSSSAAAATTASASSATAPAADDAANNNDAFAAPAFVLDGGAAAAAPPPSTSSIALLEARSR